MTDIPDPVDALRNLHHQALDQQATLATQARALAVRVREVTAALNKATTQARLYGDILNALTRPATTAPAKTTRTKP